MQLENRPKSARDAGEFEDEISGLTGREITTDLRINLNLPPDVQGVIVRRVKSGSMANIARVLPGMIIMNFGEHSIRSVDEFKKAVENTVKAKPTEFTVFCRVGSATRFFRFAPRWDEDR